MPHFLDDSIFKSCTRKISKKKNLQMFKHYNFFEYVYKSKNTEHRYYTAIVAS